ncbi:dipeptide epimerase [candidate division KSB1 bacterium]|nr:dipeptide epimerase [candidate division KSB1 bacterium]
MTRKEFFKTTGKALAAAGALRAGLIPVPIFSCAPTPEKGVRLSYKKIRLFLKHTWTIARGSSDFKDNVFVRLEKDGVYGLGEAAPNIRYQETWESTVELIEKARSLLEEGDPWKFGELGHRILAIAEGQTAAKAALDIALMDWVTKKLRVPLYRYLGLDKSKTPLTSFTIGIDTPEVMKAKVKEAEEFPLLKIKVGLKNDEEILGAIRSVTDKPLRVDANEGWKSKEEALEKIRWLEGMGVEFIEQPLPSSMLEETKWLRERVKLPIIADEAVKSARDIPRLATAYDGINIKLMKAGGVQEALRMIAMAKSLGMKIMLGCMIESSVAISAAAHLSPLVDYADLDGNLLISNDPFEGVRTEKGRLILPDRPGLGIKGDL